MKSKSALELLTVLLIYAGSSLGAFGQGTAFTYQGRLNDSTVPANGVYDLEFALFQNASGGSAVLGPLTNSAVTVSNGLFTTLLDFGPYDADAYGRGKWLEISVRTNGAGSLTVLGPRQQLTPAPSAIFATYAGGPPPGLGFTFTNLTAFSPPSGPPFTVNSTTRVTNLNADLLDGLDSSAFWQLAGNSGINTNTQFLGTTDNKPLNLKVGNQLALQIMPGVSLPNIVGGLSALRPTVLATNISGAVVAGGNAPSGPFSGIGAGDFMAVYDDDGTIGGGFGNKVGSNNNNPADAAFATVAGGLFNVSSAFAAVIAGGAANTAGGQFSAIAGGNNNTIASNSFSAIGGGDGNVIQTNANHSTVAGGFGNQIQQNAIESVIGGGNSNVVRTFVADAVIAGGFQNSVGVGYSAIGGGAFNVNNGSFSVIGGGEFNENLALLSVIAGGSQNTNLALGSAGGAATISGGALNLVTNDYATVPGGLGNVAGGSGSFAAGILANALHDDTFVWSDGINGAFASTAQNQFLIHAVGGVGIGTPSPQGSLHVYSDNNPTIVRIQSTGTPGFGRVEFVSNPQSDVNQWRPGYIQSFDNGGFTGGLGFYVNGTGAGNKFGSIEVMRVVNGNVGIGITSPTNKLHVAGGVSATAFINTSDRNAKENFAPVSPGAVLEKVVALPITTWNFKDLRDGRHMGPMAQDFYAAFGLGGSDTTITSVDPDGVALAAIQGLDEKVEGGIKNEELYHRDVERKLQQKETEITELKRKNESLEQRLEAVEQLIRNQRSN